VAYEMRKTAIDYIENYDEKMKHSRYQEIMQMMSTEMKVPRRNLEAPASSKKIMFCEMINYFLTLRV
jgi:hypothetical protein